MKSAILHRANGSRTLRDQSRRVLDDVKGLGSIAAANVGDGTARLKARGRELVSSGRDAMVRYRGNVTGYVAANPFKALFMAMGVGALLGLVLRRRSN